MIELIDCLYEDIAAASGKKAEAKIEFEKRIAAHDPNGKEAYLKKRVFKYKTEIASSWLGRLWANSNFEDVERVNIVYAAFEYFKDSGSRYKNEDLLKQSIKELIEEFIEDYIVIKVLEKDAGNDCNRLLATDKPYSELRKKLDSIGFFDLELVKAQKHKESNLLNLISSPPIESLSQVESSIKKPNSKDKISGYQIAMLDFLGALDSLRTKHKNTSENDIHEELQNILAIDNLDSVRRQYRNLYKKEVHSRFKSREFKAIVKKDYFSL